jgi:hypothetical protein
MTRRLRTAVNRALLGGVGTGFLLVGAWLASTDGDVVPWLPSWWPTAVAGGALPLDAEGLTRWPSRAWWAPTAIVVASVMTVLGTWWALAQFGSGQARRLALPCPGGSLRPRALADALSLRAESLPGVVRCRTRVLPRAGGRVDIVLRVRLRTGTRPDAVLPGLRTLAAGAERSLAPGLSRTRIRLSAEPGARGSEPLGAEDSGRGPRRFDDGGRGGGRPYS